MYDGGYYLLPEQFIRAGLNKHTCHLTRPFGAETIRAINTVQNTAWRINLGIALYIREGKIFQNSPGERVAPTLSAHPESHGRFTIAAAARP